MQTHFPHAHIRIGNNAVKCRARKVFGQYEIASVAIGAIQEQDAFTARFLAAQQYEPDTVVDLDCWDRGVVEALALRFLPILVRRQSGFHYLGVGHVLRIMQQCLEPDEEVPAILLESKRISNKIRLDVLASEILLLAPLFRTRRFLPRRLMQLWKAILGAGGNPIQGDGVRAFSRATGYSHNALMPPKQPKMAQPNPANCAGINEHMASEGEA
jgi:hypothetical protein